MKSHDEFHKNRSQKDGFSRRCKECLCEEQRVWRKVNAERLNAAARERYRQDPAYKQRKLELRHRRYHSDVEGNRARYRAARRLKDYGLSPESFNALLASQGFRCAACGSDSPGSRVQDWHVDHCHTTGNVRGILCMGCNIAIGFLRDCPARALGVHAYLTRNHQPSR